MTELAVARLLPPEGLLRAAKLSNTAEGDTVWLRYLSTFKIYTTCSQEGTWHVWMDARDAAKVTGRETAAGTPDMQTARSRVEALGALDVSIRTWQDAGRFELTHTAESCTGHGGGGIHRRCSMSNFACDVIHPALRGAVCGGPHIPQQLHSEKSSRGPRRCIPRVCLVS
eukprot:comp68622_c0_seq1/m.48077 comp68622_c0_seq1/g.48077  ORF comp68622_c0_seq1/g.48077 comp68622_c0_seq1/m.48077 type:complete len:170 (-) comp68622_c0_seq1:467-976(-)